MAMPHPESPRRPSSVDVSCGLDSGSPSKASFCTLVPLLSSASPKPSSLPPTMATALSETTPSKDQSHLGSGFMGLGEPSTLQWAEQCEMGASQPCQNGRGYGGVFPGQVDYSGPRLDYSPNGLPFSSNYSLTYPTFDPSCPRSYAGGLELSNGMDNITMAESYPPSAYVINPPKSHDDLNIQDTGTSNQLLQFNNDFETQCGARFKSEACYAGSAYGSAPGSRCSTPHDDCGYISSRDARDEDGSFDKEQPYAQLIYRALMEAPGHTMVLRDIYEWFKQNTNKAEDKETKGWQNSIRHNLSMNGAFEKVDQPCDDTRKGYMWKLTDEAIREGVKSTTRYRSKQPHKRGHRTGHNPLPQRQASGAKGGLASRKSAKARRLHRAVTDPYFNGNGGGDGSAGGRITNSATSTYDGAILEPLVFNDPYPSLSSLSSFHNPPTPSSPYYGSDLDLPQDCSAPVSLDGGSSHGLGSPLLGPDLDLGLDLPLSMAMRGSNGCHASFGGASSPAMNALVYDAAYLTPQEPSAPLFYDLDLPDSSASRDATAAAFSSSHSPQQQQQLQPPRLRLHPHLSNLDVLSCSSPSASSPSEPRTPDDVDCGPGLAEDCYIMEMRPLTGETGGPQFRFFTDSGPVARVHE
ncbi:uncharacterized protein EI97DRAFT_460189 [Westerdykella ornata]|uniref:Fork-head domain-containing protein n=1 Tax=Westerdykella ornata TaxID=318751 RepID=A0A6A6JD13_WESOR|nr:uncharacterized protein EI97DRAFT_460189 [Westerdykella ornata]KAF2274322.1 hypothetical protein EI97DRAFT_460189 [Westerdykella ornata]